MKSISDGAYSGAPARAAAYATNIRAVHSRYYQHFRLQTDLNTQLQQLHPSSYGSAPQTGSCFAFQIEPQLIRTLQL